ncbi:MAG: hypothetical protein HY700_18975 [Gemmatimonadetes bacterium]|nr:hypothetical protein [Gemmatimonadota bacterium]
MDTRKSPLLRLAALAAVTASLACADPTDEGGTDPSNTQTTSVKDKAILTSAEARAAFEYVKATCDGVDRAVPTNFTAPYVVRGSAGTASVRGTKTSSTSSTSSSTSTTRTSNLTVAFTDFKATSGSGSINGTATWYDYYYSRTACSSTTCASASDHSESLKGSALAVKFQYNGATYSDRITINASSGKDTSSWDVTITNQAGGTFTFTYR